MPCGLPGFVLGGFYIPGSAPSECRCSPVIHNPVCRSDTPYRATQRPGGGLGGDGEPPPAMRADDAPCGSCSGLPAQFDLDLRRYLCAECAAELLHGRIPPASPLFPAGLPEREEDGGLGFEDAVRRMEGGRDHLLLERLEMRTIPVNPAGGRIGGRSVPDGPLTFLPEVG